MHIAVVGLSHRTAPVEIRERLSIPEQTMEQSLQLLRDDEQVLEASILSTCNRLEIYALLRHPELLDVAEREATEEPAAHGAHAVAPASVGLQRGEAEKRQHGWHNPVRLHAGRAGAKPPAKLPIHGPAVWPAGDPRKSD